MKLIVGDRVSVYYSGCPDRNYGTVMSMPADDGTFVIKYDGGIEYTCRVHLKQCRKLKPPQRKRELYAIVPDHSTFTVTATFDPELALKLSLEGAKPKGQIVKFKEVLVKR